MVNKTNVVGYVRVSTANQVEKGDGLEIQRKRIIEFCKERGMPITRFYADRGISGAVKDRPALLELLKDCESGTVSKVIVYKQDRLSRELTVALWLETQFKKFDIELNSVVDPEYDLEDPLQKAFKRIADIFAELEKDVISVRLKEGRINRAKNGQRGSGPIPFGYRKIDGELEVDRQEAVWVEKAFRLAAKGCSYTKIIRTFNKGGVETRRGRPFQIESLKYLLRNKIYYGATEFGPIRTKGIHQPVISRRLFVKVQKRMGHSG